MAFWLIVIISLAVAGALLVIPVIRKNEISGLPPGMS